LPKGQFAIAGTSLALYIRHRQTGWLAKLTGGGFSISNYARYGDYGGVPNWRKPLCNGRRTSTLTWLKVTLANSQAVMISLRFRQIARRILKQMTDLEDTVESPAETLPTREGRKSGRLLRRTFLISLLVVS